MGDENPNLLYCLKMQLNLNAPCKKLQRNLGKRSTMTLTFGSVYENQDIKISILTKYDKVVNGLTIVDPNNDNFQEFVSVFDTVLYTSFNCSCTNLKCIL